MAGSIEIDDKGFKRMIKELRKRTGMSFRDVVRGSAANVLTNTAGRTKSATEQTAVSGVKALLRKPLKLLNGDRVGVTKEGKVWYSGAGWLGGTNGKRWVLVSSNGQLEMPGDRVWRTKEGARVSRTKLSPRLKGQIQNAIREAIRIREREEIYRRSMVGLGKASWLQIMRELNLKIPKRKSIGQASKIRVPRAVRTATSGKEMGNADKFEITILNKTQTALNKHAKGTAAFRSAFNSEVKKFERNLKKDIVKYSKKFAKQNGFKVK